MNSNSDDGKSARYQFAHVSRDEEMKTDLNIRMLDRNAAEAMADLMGEYRKRTWSPGKPSNVRIDAPNGVPLE